jgi:hypothetical protein
VEKDVYTFSSRTRFYGIIYFTIGGLPDNMTKHYDFDLRAGVFIHRQVALPFQAAIGGPVLPFLCPAVPEFQHGQNSE